MTQNVNPPTSGSFTPLSTGYGQGAPSVPTEKPQNNFTHSKDLISRSGSEIGQGLKHGTDGILLGIGSGFKSVGKYANRQGDRLEPNRPIVAKAFHSTGYVLHGIRNVFTKGANKIAGGEPEFRR